MGSSAGSPWRRADVLCTDKYVSRAILSHGLPSLQGKGGEVKCAVATFLGCGLVILLPKKVTEILEPFAEGLNLHPVSGQFMSHNS